MRLTSVYLRQPAKFPSPFGVRVLKFILDTMVSSKSLWFPSPFGVRVLKFLEGAAFVAAFYGVSVPFRGSCSEILIDEMRLMEITAAVSVPFRGSCSEMRLYAYVRRGEWAGFRPLSGFVF